MKTPSVINPVQLEMITSSKIEIPKTRLLYVEDNQDDVDLLELVLNKSSLKFSLVSASSKMELDVLDLNSFDIVLSDYNITGCTGLDIIKTVKNKRPMMPLIILTGTVGEELAVDLIHAGADDFLLKQNIKKLPIIISRAKKSIELQQEKREFRQEVVQKNLILDNILDSSSSALYLKDTEGRYQIVNKTLCERTGLRADQIIGKTSLDVFSDEINRKNSETDQYVVEHGLPTKYEVEITHPDGRLRLLEVSKRPLKEGSKVIGIVGETKDITAERQLINDLKRSQGILNQAEKITESGSFEYNSELDLLTISRNLKTMLGLNFEGVTISLRRLITLFKSEDREILTTGIFDAIDNKHDYSGQHRLKKDEAYRTFNVFLKPDMDVHSDLYYGTVIDITNESENSEQEYTRQENDRKEIARELHDNLGQKLNAMSMYLGKSSDPSDKAQSKIRDLIHDSIDDLSVLINSISVKQIEEHSLSYAIDKLLEYVPESISIDRELEFSEEVISSQIKTHVFRVIQEAVNNAIKYSNAATLKISLKEKENMLDLFIEDDGDGFETESGLKGNGLKNIQYRVRKSNGLVSIQSKEGLGTKIVAKLPCN